MKRYLTILIPIALAACQTVPSNTAIADPPDAKVVTVEDKADAKPDAKLDDAPPADDKQSDKTDDNTALKGGDDAPVQKTEEKAPAKEPTDETQQVVVPRNFVEYYKSDLVMALISDSIVKDDVALMGIVSGTRAYCQLRWEPGFITFMNAAHRQGLDLNLVADDHGYYHGAAVKALASAEYQCTEKDLIDLRAVEPY